MDAKGKKLILTGLSALFGVGAFVVDMLSENNKVNEAAEKAAKIVMDQMSK